METKAEVGVMSLRTEEIRGDGLEWLPQSRGKRYLSRHSGTPGHHERPS